MGIRAVTLALLVVAAACSAGSVTSTSGEIEEVSSPRVASTVPPPSTVTTLPELEPEPTQSTVATSTTTTLVPSDGLTAAQRAMELITTITGDISPKSVVASENGLFFAQNMMYRHTITVYDRSHQLVETIDDTVIPAAFGYFEFEGEFLGSPVEAAFTSDGSHGFVSNYRMYGGGLSTAASDDCNAGNWPDSFVYRIDTSVLEIDRLIRVGSVPKFLAVTPDDRLLLVSNWCGFDLSVIDLETLEELARVPLGRHPRGIAVSPDSTEAYVAIMGSSSIARVDLDDFTVRLIEGVGRSPRHLVMSPDGQFLYASLNGDDRLAKIDLNQDRVVGTVTTGDAPRSMTISSDGSALYVVNYNSATVSKVRTSDMVEIEEHSTGVNPIGITYDSATRQIWVSNYSGTIQVFADIAPG